MGAVTLSTSVCLAALGLQPIEPVAQEHVDLVEINHYYDQRGKLVLDQVIFYEWCAERCRYQVRDWRLLKSANQLPRRNRHGNDYGAVWRDGQVLRKVHARAVRETWTLYDPEVADREYLPKNRRRKFSKSMQVALEKICAPKQTTSVVAQTER